MKKLFLMGSALALLLTACKKDDDETNMDSNTQDQTFVTQAYLNNNVEIRLGQLAATRSTNPGIQTFAHLMVTEHGQAQNDLSSVANAVSVNIKDSLDAQGQTLMTRLDTLQGLSFDTAYINSQVKAHQAAVSQFQTEISAGANQSVKNYASKYLPHIQMHYQMADSLSATF